MSAVAALMVLWFPAASAADPTLAADPSAERITALDGTVVWVSGSFPQQTLMWLSDDGAVGRVQGAPRRAYRSIDLGRDARGRATLTYLRCTGTRRCTAFADDLRGHRRALRLAPAGCRLTTAPARWGSRVAYGLAWPADGRSGLYLKSGTRPARRVPLPADAVRFGVDAITWADLRGTRVAGVAADIYAYAFSQLADGTGRRSFLAAASEGDTDAHVRGLALGRRGALWTLVTAEHAGDPDVAVITRDTGRGCAQFERLANPPGVGETTGFGAVGLAVEGDNLYLAVPGKGVVRHSFLPQAPC